jgi:alanine racemase
VQTYRCWAEVDLGALRANLARLRHAVAPGVRIMTVVKADAYGHGLRQIAALLMQNGTDVFGVANLAEAQAIRGVGRGWPILMLGPCLPDEVETAVRDDVMPTLSSLEEAVWFSKAGGRLGKTVSAHLKVDTGMGRLGCPPAAALELARQINTLPALRLEGLYTHYSSVEEDAAFSRSQRTKFERLVRQMGAAGLVIPTIHANNSGAILLEPDPLCNLVRPGLLVYGVAPPGPRTARPGLETGWRPALSLKCRVGFLKEIPRGAPVSYGRSFVAPRRMRLATLTAGYGDGYLRSGGNRSQILLGGTRCPVVGRVTMDQTMIDCSMVEAAAVGDEAVLIGPQRGDAITATELAGWCGTVPWEVLTNITHRVPRLYRGAAAA